MGCGASINKEILSEDNVLLKYKKIIKHKNAYYKISHLLEDDYKKQNIYSFKIKLNKHFKKNTNNIVDININEKKKQMITLIYDFLNHKKELYNMRI